MSKWIPTSERLPKVEKSAREYLVTMPLYGTLQGYQVTTLYYGNYYYSKDTYTTCWFEPNSEYGEVIYDDEDVVAWMPMPKPYRRMTGRNLWQKLCCKVTDHRHRKLIAHTVHDENCPPDCPTEYHYKCRICGKTFWNYSPPAGRQIPKWYKEQAHD